MKSLKGGCNVNKCLMCKLCMKDWLPAIAAHRKNFRAAKGETLFNEGQEMNGIYFIYAGLVKVHKKWENDKELIVRFARDGDIVGHRGLGKDLLFPVSATAIEATTLCFIQLDFFYSTLKVNQQFLYELMMFYASELKESENNMRNLAHMPVKGRIAQALLNLQQKFGVDKDGYIDIGISRQDLSSYVGTSYETLFRMLNELLNEDAVVSIGRKVAIKDVERLRRHITF